MAHGTGVKQIKDQKAFATGVFYLVFGTAVAVGAGRYRMGSLARMGPGYFPCAAGVALALVGACMIGLALRRGAPVSQAGAWSGRSVSIVLLAVVLFGLLLEQIGLVIAVPMLVGLSSRAHPHFSWRSLVVSLLVLMFLTWTIFVLLLGLPFPMLPAFLAG